MKILMTWSRAVRAIAVSAALATLAAGVPRAEDPKQVVVVNTPTVQAQQSGPWTVAIQGGIGIDPAKNLVTLAAPPPVQPYQTAATIFIDYPDDTWQTTFAVPSDKRLVIEYVSGEFTKKIGGGSDPSQPPFLFTVTTTAGGHTVAHVVPVRGIYDYAGAQSWFQMAESLRLYADAGTNVTVKLHHLFSAGYQEQGTVGLSGQLLDTP
jgi:hypothetical protein